jgi:uncharacterized membrane protein YeaQ/YmgE (transglycosylase-associated protein family)
MNLLVMCVLGGVLGWLASRVISGSSDLGITANVIVGSVGALVAAICVSTLVGKTPPAAMSALIGTFGAVGGVGMLRWLSVPTPSAAGRRARR